MEYKIDGTAYTGKNAADAVGQNFKSIAEGKIGKVEGYLLERVWIEKVNDSEAALHILSHGSGSRPNYDPQKDKSEEKIFRIEGDFCCELFTPYEFDLKPREKSYRDPYSDEHIEESDWVIAAAEALLDTLTLKFGANKELPLPTQRVSDRAPTAKMVSAQNYARSLGQELDSRAFIRSATATRMKDRIRFLLAKFKVLDARKINESAEILYYYQIKAWLERNEKITALAYYRQKAGLTQQELADRCSISRRQIQNYESDSSPLGDAKYSFIVALCDVLSIKPEDLLDGGEARYVSN